MTPIGTVEWFPAGPIEIRDGTIAVVKAMPGFSDLFGDRVFGNRVMPTKVEQLPLACVWHIGDRTEPWGDANVGAPSFNHTLTMAVDVMTAAGQNPVRSGSSTEDQLNAEIVSLVERVRATLLTDPDWVQLSEGVTRADVTYTYPQDGSFAYARGVIEFELKFRSEWSPADPADFRTMALQVGTDPNSAFYSTITLPGADT